MSTLWFSQYQDNDIAGRDEEAEEGRGMGKLGALVSLSLNMVVKKYHPYLMKHKVEI